MNKKKPETFVLSVGGSLIVTKDGIDIKFLKSFRAFILKQIKSGRKFFMVVGGGQTARTYMQAALAITSVPAQERDWVGIRSTRLNAQLLKAVFGRQAHPEIITNPSDQINTKKPLVFAAGYQPGHSTDYDAILLAKANGIKSVVNLSNIDYAYDCDPNKYPDAKRLETITWLDFRKIVGNRWQPGLNVPFDPVASREAARLGLEVAIINGRKLANLEAYLEGRNFHGTLIS